MDYTQFIQNYGYVAGYTYLKTNNRAEAKRILESYIRFDEVSAWDLLGHIYFDESDYDMAIKSWNSALTAAKNLNREYFWSDGNVFVKLGAAYANKNNKAEMCKNYRAGMGFGNEEATRRYNAQCK
jgi:tetratricopeptide (TPR) repeat protein